MIVEDFLPGIEASYLVFSDGSSIRRMLPSQDHKALLDNDRGPNTGGMGAYTPLPFIGRAMEERHRRLDNEEDHRCACGTRALPIRACSTAA